MKRPIEYFADHTWGSDSLRLGEHEVLLAFHNDSGAYAFSEWWNANGSSFFREWVENNLDDLNQYG